MEKKLVFVVSVSYLHFRFDNAEDAVAFAKTALMTLEREDSISIVIEFENNEKEEN